MLISHAKPKGSGSMPSSMSSRLGAWREQAFPVLVVCVSAALTIMTFTAMGAALAQIA